MENQKNNTFTNNGNADADPLEVLAVSSVGSQGTPNQKEEDQQELKQKIQNFNDKFSKSS